MTDIGYYDRILIEDDHRSLRYNMLRYAREHGIKPAARLFGTTPGTVRKWLRRCPDPSPEELIDMRTQRKIRPSKIPLREKRKALALKRKYPSFGSMRIKRQFKLNISDKAIRKIWKEHGLL